MDTNAVLDVGLAAMLLAAKLCAPVLVTALVVGFAVSLLQSITQIQEVTLSFVPKIVVMGIVTILAVPWLTTLIMEFARRMFGGMN